MYLLSFPNVSHKLLLLKIALIILSQYLIGQVDLFERSVLAFVAIVIIQHRETGVYHRETSLVTEIINFTIETLVFEKRHLNGAHSISDIKLRLMDV